MRPYRCRYSAQRFTNDLHRAARRTCRTGCCPPCGSSSAGTWRKPSPGDDRKKNPMEMEVFADPNEVARNAATFIAAQARDAVELRGRFVLAVSGGRTPWRMLRHLADELAPWQ